MNDDIDKEIERLKQVKTEIATKISLTNDFNAKEELEAQLSMIASQVKTLEIFKKRL
jgi:hypothetical protein